MSTWAYCLAKQELSSRYSDRQAMSVKHHKCAIVPMLGKRSGVVEFELLIYGRTAAELMTVPNEVIHSISERYPEHQSSPFLLRDLRGETLDDMIAQARLNQPRFDSAFRRTKR